MTRRYDNFAVWRRQADPNYPYPYGDPPGVTKTLFQVVWNKLWAVARAVIVKVRDR